jgi:hypothetical protein
MSVDGKVERRFRLAARRMRRATVPRRASSGFHTRLGRLAHIIGPDWAASCGGRRLLGLPSAPWPRAAANGQVMLRSHFQSQISESGRGAWKAHEASRSPEGSQCRLCEAAAMDESPAERLSDEERERAASALKQHLLAGRLTTDEFSQRVELAYEARVGSDLAVVMDGLPQEPTPASVAVQRRRASRLTGAVLSHVVRRGPRRIRGWTVAGSALGDLDLDLREAELSRAQTVVNVVALFGNVDVYVPDQIAVTLGGLGVVGHQRDHGIDASRADAPSIHVRVLSLFATIDVWRVPADLKGSYGEILKEVKRRQRSDASEG